MPCSSFKTLLQLFCLFQGLWSHTPEWYTSNWFLTVSFKLSNGKSYYFKCQKEKQKNIIIQSYHAHHTDIKSKFILNSLCPVLRGWCSPFSWGLLCACCSPFFGSCFGCPIIGSCWSWCTSGKSWSCCWGCGFCSPLKKRKLCYNIISNSCRGCIIYIANPFLKHWILYYLLLGARGTWSCTRQVKVRCKTLFLISWKF